MNHRKYRAAEQELWKFFELEPSERMVTLAGTNTKVRVQELGAGDPVLLIHGGPNAGSTWAPLVKHLDGFRCFLVDRPGTGLSEPFRVTAENLADFGARIVGDGLDGLQIHRAHVVASSFGGQLALRSAAADPGRFDRMVQMAAPAAVPGQVFPPFMNSQKSPLARMLMNSLPQAGPSTAASCARSATASVSRRAGSPMRSSIGIWPSAATPTPCVTMAG